MRYYSNFPNRTICQVLEEMRKACSTLNFSILPGLIEECQTLANRMEAGLENKKDYNSMRDNLKELRREIDKLERKKKELEDGKSNDNA